MSKRERHIMVLKGLTQTKDVVEIIRSFEEMTDAEYEKHLEKAKKILNRI